MQWDRSGWQVPEVSSMVLMLMTVVSRRRQASRMSSMPLPTLLQVLHPVPSGGRASSLDSITP